MKEDILPEDQQESLEDVESPELGKNANAVLAASDWTTQTILDQLKRGNIDLNPLFQRRDAWKPARKSQFIESLVLGLPVPQLVLAERKEKRGSYIVIDGKQRLLSLRQFAADADDSEFDSLKLQGLRVRPDLNGHTYASLRDEPELDAELTSFENQTIRTVVIRNWPGEKFLYTVFLRLNTGSVPLSPQELRQALHPGDFSAFVNSYSAECELLKQVLNLEEPDFRMRDTELVIRYLAFRNFLEDYSGNLKQILDQTTNNFNEDWASSKRVVRTQLKEFEEAIQATVDIFGTENAFRKWNGNDYEGRINRAIFDVMVQYFIEPAIASAARRKPKQVVQAFKNLCVKDSEFRASIEGTTKSIGAVATRLGLWGKTLKAVTKVPIRIPKSTGSKIVFP